MVNDRDDASPWARTVVVPAAGMGTRFLPATKTVPKELLPVVDTPGIELIAEEAAAVGADRLAIITAPNKQEVMRHFEAFPDLVQTLEARGKDSQSAKVKRAHSLLNPIAVEQADPLGLGHAVGLAEDVLAVDEEFFGVMLPDDIVLPNNAMEQMVAVRNKLGGSVLLAVEVPREQTFNYGVFDIEATDDDGVKRLSAWWKSRILWMRRLIWWLLGVMCWIGRFLMRCAGLLRARVVSCS